MIIRKNRSNKMINLNFGGARNVEEKNGFVSDGIWYTI